MYNIPLFKLNYGDEEKKAVIDTLDSMWISMGPQCEKMEKKFSDMLHVAYACAVTNCTAALHLACAVLDIKSGDEVICPSLTFAATANCIRYVGATPVFCDIISKENLCIDVEDVKRLITPKTKAIIVMHYAGFPCDMEAILDVAQKHNLYVIEDACHAPLSEYNGNKLGTMGDVGCFSFFSNKNISSGEGGMLVTNNEELYHKMKLMRSHGMTTMSYERSKGHATSYDIQMLGYNYRMDDIRASLVNVQLDKLEPDIKRRQFVRSLYLNELNGVESIVIPFKDNREFVSNYIFPIVLKYDDSKKRDDIREYLKENGIQTSVHYPAIHLFSDYQSYHRDMPVTEYVTRNEITLPMYGSLEETEIYYIVDILKRGLDKFF